MSDIATTPKPPAKSKANGHAPAIDPTTDPGEYFAFPQRPYVSEVESFALRREVELAYADSELKIVRGNMAALKVREAELIKIRDAALHGLGILNKREETDDDRDLE